MVGLFKIIIFFLIIYLVLNILKIVFFAGKNTEKIKQKMDTMKDSNAGDSGNSEENKRDGNVVIELDKDQYKVE